MFFLFGLMFKTVRSLTIYLVLGLIIVLLLLEVPERRALLRGVINKGQQQYEMITKRVANSSSQDTTQGEPWDQK